MIRNILLVFALVSITVGALGINGCSVTVQPTLEPVQSSPYYQPPPRPFQEDIGFFYDQLAPYGEWFQLQSYGWVWTPHDVPDGWRPYTDGRWAYTDYGWTWVSDWEWGWAPFHYGRWLFDPYYGWVWVPGREWAPAWVAWHYGSGWVGWAPLPPGVNWQIGVNIDSRLFHSPPFPSFPLIVLRSIRLPFVQGSYGSKLKNRVSFPKKYTLSPIVSLISQRYIISQVDKIRLEALG
jgi:hypothetical protein